MPRQTIVRPTADEATPSQVASTMPDAFTGLDCRVLSGEPEQLITRLDDVLGATDQHMAIGTVADLDTLPFPDWSIFPYWQFKVGYDFYKFPTAYVQSSRGCTLSCTYCPYIILENKVRTRSPALVAEEIRRGMEEYDFRSFKFRDPLFGATAKPTGPLPVPLPPDVIVIQSVLFETAVHAQAAPAVTATDPVPPLPSND